LGLKLSTGSFIPQALSDVQQRGAARGNDKDRLATCAGVCLVTSTLKKRDLLGGVDTPDLFTARFSDVANVSKRKYTEVRFDPTCAPGQQGEDARKSQQSESSYES